MNERILKRRERRERVGLSEPTLWRLERAGKFPARRQISAGRVGWLEREIEDWINNSQKICGSPVAAK
jgi:prophage regulatory protein